MSTIPTAPGLESLTLLVTKEIQVQASLEDTFAALLEQLGPENTTPEGVNMQMKLEAVAGRKMVARPGRQQRTLLGTCAGDQAADAAGDFGTAVYVLRGGFECAVPAERIGWRDTDHVSSQGDGRDPGRPPGGRQPGLDAHAGGHSRTGRSRLEMRSGYVSCMCGDGGVAGKRRDFDWRVERFDGEGISRQKDND